MSTTKASDNTRDEQVTSAMRTMAYAGTSPYLAGAAWLAALVRANQSMDGSELRKVIDDEVEHIRSVPHYVPDESRLLVDVKGIVALAQIGRKVGLRPASKPQQTKLRGGNPDVV